MTDGARFVVVGAGLAGSATAWQLARRGEDVLLLESVAPAHGGGSSHGSARIFRHAYPDPLYAGMTVRALAGWRELEVLADEQLLTTTGGLDFGRQRDVPRMAETLETLGLPSEVLSADAAAERWPHLQMDTPVLYQPDAGVIDAEAAVLAMVRLAREAGARVATGWRLARVEERPSGVRLHAHDGDAVDAEVVVIAAGAWLPELLDGLPLPTALRDALPELRVTQQQAFHFGFPGEQAPSAPGDWPIFVHKDELAVYSLPGGRDAGGRGFKIAEHDGGGTTTASTRDRRVDPAARERIVDYVRERIPGADPVPYAETTCLYTSTPDEDFVIDRVGGLVIASPCSGHGAKFAPLLGELIADLAAGTGEVPGRFRIGRRPGPRA